MPWYDWFRATSERMGGLGSDAIGHRMSLRGGPHDFQHPSPAKYLQLPRTLHPSSSAVSHKYPISPHIHLATHNPLRPSNSRPLSPSSISATLAGFSPPIPPAAKHVRTQRRPQEDGRLGQGHADRRPGRPQSAAQPRSQQPAQWPQVRSCDGAGLYRGQ